MNFKKTDVATVLSVFVSEFSDYCNHALIGGFSLFDDLFFAENCLRREADRMKHYVQGVVRFLIQTNNAEPGQYDHYFELIDSVLDATLKTLKSEPDDFGRPSAGASGAAVGQGDNSECNERNEGLAVSTHEKTAISDHIPDDAYTVDHVEPDPDACPDCYGTGLDFTHHADFCHCVSCKITHQPGNAASSALFNQSSFRAGIMGTYREELESLLTRCPNIKTWDHIRVVAFKTVLKESLSALKSVHSSEAKFKSFLVVLSGYYEDSAGHNS